MIDDQDVTGAFTLGKRGGTALRVIERARPHLLPGEGVGPVGASRAGKSAPTRLTRHNDRIDAGSICVSAYLATALPRAMIASHRMRHCVSPFRRLSRIENVAQPLPMPGAPGGGEARALGGRANATTFGPDRTAA